MLLPQRVRGVLLAVFRLRSRRGGRLTSAGPLVCALVGAVLIAVVVPAAPAGAGQSLSGRFLARSTSDVTQAGGQPRRGTDTEVPRAADVGLRLAVEESPTESELPGPEPSPSTPFAPKAYERPWTWWLGVVLTVAAAVGVSGVGLGYWLLVKRGGG